MWNTRLSELEFDGDELAGAIEAIESNWITSGSRTQAFERAFAELCGTREAVAVSNGTAALILALKAIGVGPGDEVLCPSLTFVATASAILHCGAIPVFVDITSLDRPTMDPADAARKVTPNTAAILPVHYAGVPCDMRSLMDLASSRNLRIVEDAAHAPGASFEGRPCGSFGAAGCFSLFGNKNITTAEGGVVTTNDPELARLLRLLRSHGMTTTSWDRDKGRPAHYDVVEIGFNFRFDDIRGALGLAQLKKLPDINRRRAALASRYNEAFGNAPAGWAIPFRATAPDSVPAYHIYPIVLSSGDERNQMEIDLRDRGIQTSVHYRPVHQLSAIRKRFPGVHLPLTEEFGARELTLPLYASLDPDQIDTIVDAVIHAHSHV